MLQPWGENRGQLGNRNSHRGLSISKLEISEAPFNLIKAFSDFNLIRQNELYRVYKCRAFHLDYQGKEPLSPSAIVRRR